MRQRYALVYMYEGTDNLSEEHCAPVTGLFELTPEEATEVNTTIDGMQEVLGDAAEGDHFFYLLPVEAVGGFRDAFQFLTKIQDEILPPDGDDG